MLGSKTHLLLRVGAILVIAAAALMPSSRHRGTARLDGERSASAQAPSHADAGSAARVVEIARR